MARLAIILQQGNLGPRELRLGRILDFFGVPWKAVQVAAHKGMEEIDSEAVVFGSIRAVVAALELTQEAGPRDASPVAFYAYLDDEASLCGDALQSLLPDARPLLQEAPAGEVSLRVSDELADLTGPMAGLNFSLRLRGEDAVLSGVPCAGEMTAVVVSAANAPVFFRLRHHNTQIFVCTSSNMVDIDDLVGQGFYDIKRHFCSAVPLVMFIKFMFRDIAWQPQELGACLIIDDPLLKLAYGFCNFPKLRELMQEYGFTTNIAFIPWNWRRTSPAAGKFFADESGLFSVSIHGCDHTAGEFAAASRDVLQRQAQLARSRMQSHEARTGIKHDSLMVFPQGAFSSACPGVLKGNGFLAAVNTEIGPVDAQNVRTRIRDVWDVAIMTYDDFPIFTRRYAFHGLENFAFDLLLGKPCLVVAHHDSFKDGGAAMLALIEKIGSLHCRLHWRPLGEVIRRACRRRTIGVGAEQVEMYGNELTVCNRSDQAIDVRISKRRSQEDTASGIYCDDKPITWKSEAERFVFGGRIDPRSEKCFRLVYPEQAPAVLLRRSLRFELSVATRRMLSEFRDEYLSTSRFLNAPAQRLKSMLRRPT
jgi:hypothetical protein